MLSTIIGLAIGGVLVKGTAAMSHILKSNFSKVELTDEQVAHILKKDAA